MNQPPACTIVIPTHRAGPLLRETLLSFGSQTFLPSRMVVVDASVDRRAREFIPAGLPFPLCHLPYLGEPGAAVQRNAGARDVETPLVAFFDDDIQLSPDTLERLCRVWDQHPEAGGVAARIEGMEHKQPSRLLRAYYRMQAGRDHPHYGGGLFGAAVNCWPAYSLEKTELIPAMWLNSACVVYQTDLFQREQFPQFTGAAFLEDVHLSARIARTHPLYFHRSARVVHLDGGRSERAMGWRQARSAMRNRRITARDAMGVRGAELFYKMMLHRLFASIWVTRNRKPGWPGEILGIWWP